MVPRGMVIDTGQTAAETDFSYPNHSAAKAVMKVEHMVKIVVERNEPRTEDESQDSERPKGHVGELHQQT